MLRKLKEFGQAGEKLDLLQIGRSAVENAASHKEALEEELGRPFWKTAVLGVMTGVMAFNMMGAVAGQVAEASESRDILNALSQERLASVQSIDSDELSGFGHTMADNFAEIEEMLGRKMIVIDVREDPSLLEEQLSDLVSPEELTHIRETYEEIGPHAALRHHEDGSETCAVVIGDAFRGQSDTMSADEYAVNVFATGLEADNPMFAEGARFHPKLWTKEKDDEFAKLHEEGHCFDELLVTASLGETSDSFIGSAIKLDVQEQVDWDYARHGTENFADVYASLRFVQKGGTAEEVYEQFMMRSAHSLLSTRAEHKTHITDTFYNNENAVNDAMERSYEAVESGHPDLPELIDQQILESSIYVVQDSHSTYYMGNVIEPVMEFIEEHGQEGLAKMSIPEIVLAARNIINENLMSYEQFNGVGILKDGYSFKNAIAETRIDSNGHLHFHPELLEKDPNFAKYGMEAFDYFGFEYKVEDQLINKLENNVPRWMKNESAMARYMPENSPVSETLVGRAISKDIEHGAQVKGASVEAGKLRVEFMEADGGSSSSLVFADGRVMRYDANGNLASLSEDRPAIVFADGQVVHQKPPVEIAPEQAPKEAAIASSGALGKLDLAVVDSYLNASQLGSEVRTSDRVAIDVRFTKDSLQQDFYLPREMLEEIASAADKSRPRDRSVILFKDGDPEGDNNSWKGLTQAEWKKLQKSLDGYTVIRPHEGDGFSVVHYDEGKVRQLGNMGPISFYDSQGQRIHADFDFGRTDPSMENEHKQDQPQLTA